MVSPLAKIWRAGGAMSLPKVLAEGYWRFRRQHAPDKGRYQQLAELGQAPSAMVIACSDARVDVSAIFDAEAGQLFILRNVANLVPPYEPEGKYHGTSAAIEYAVLVLKVPHLIVLGHSRCGGVAAYRARIKDKVQDDSFIGRWLTMLDGLQAMDTDAAAFGRETAFELATIRSSLAHLRSFPVVQEREGAGLLTLHGLHFDLASGSLIALDEEVGNFVALVEA
jgi:carbonic anhydrase